MRVGYYIVHKGIENEITRLRRFCEKIADKNYINIVRYCKQNNGTVVNLKFGEKFASEMVEAFREARSNTERLYRIKIMTGTERGFFMEDLSNYGIYSFSNLCSFLKANSNYYIENDYDETISLATLKQMVLVKGVHLFSKKSVNDRNMQKIEKARNLIKEVVTSLNIDKKKYDQILEESFGEYTHLLLCNVMNGLEEAIR